MNRQEFLGRLDSGLAGLPQEDIAERLAFYNEMINDRMEDGLTEEEAVAAIGPVEEIVSQIIAETPLPKLVRERIRPKRQLQVWEIVLLILGSPLWIPLLIAFFAVVLSLYIVIWAVIFSLWVVFAAIAVSSLACFGASVWLIFRGGLIPASGAFGACLVLAGLAVFLFFACTALTKGAAILTKKIALGVKSLFIRKEKLS